MPGNSPYLLCPKETTDCGNNEDFLFKLDNTSDTSYTSNTGIIPQDKICDVRAAYTSSESYLSSNTNNASLLNISFAYVIEADVEVYKQNISAFSYETIAVFDSSNYTNLTVTVDGNTNVYTMVIPRGQSANASITYSQTYSTYYWNQTNTSYELNTESSGLKGWEIGLIIVGAVIFVVAVAVLAFFFAKKVIPCVKQRKSKVDSNPDEKEINSKIQNDVETNTNDKVNEEARYSNVMANGGQVGVTRNVESIPAPALPVGIANEDLPQNA